MGKKLQQHVWGPRAGWYHWERLENCAPIGCRGKGASERAQNIAHEESTHWRSNLSEVTWDISGRIYIYFRSPTLLYMNQLSLLLALLEFVIKVCQKNLLFFPSVHFRNIKNRDVWTWLIPLCWVSKTPVSDRFTAVISKTVWVQTPRSWENGGPIIYHLLTLNGQSVVSWRHSFLLSLDH